MATTLYGLLGWPVGHSVSPPMINAAFDALGVDSFYTAFAVQPERVPAAVAGLLALQAGGVNVTIPHKQQVLRLATEVTEEARLAGAVNTLKFVSATGEIFGHNTDVSGWWTSVVGRTANHQNWKRVTILGAGGASRAVFAALVLYAPYLKVVVAARNPDQTARLVADFSTLLEIRTVGWLEKEDWIAKSDLVVNSTPVGMWPYSEVSPVEDPACFYSGQVVQDLVYRPLKTRLLAEAQSRGATALDGLAMLVEQGALAVEYWTGRVPPRDRMYEVAVAAVRGQGFR